MITIQKYTTRQPITMIGTEAGVCWNSDCEDAKKNLDRGLACLKHEHGRTFEYPSVYLVIKGYSARMIRELYTHIGGLPTRLQASTRYIDYEKFDYVTPMSIASNSSARAKYAAVMHTISRTCSELEKDYGIPREDAAMLLPLGMTTTVVAKFNLRTLIDMSHQRLCSRAYWEFRDFMKDLMKALSEYSYEWEYIVKHYFVPKCVYLGRCPETHSCKEVKHDSRN